MFACLVTWRPDNTLRVASMHHHDVKSPAKKKMPENTVLFLVFSLDLSAFSSAARAPALKQSAKDVLHPLPLPAAS